MAYDDEDYPSDWASGTEEEKPESQENLDTQEAEQAAPSLTPPQEVVEEEEENVQSGVREPETAPAPPEQVEEAEPAPVPPSSRADAPQEPPSPGTPGDGLSGEDLSALDYVEDVFRQIGGGGSDAIENILNTVDETVFGEKYDQHGNIVKTFDIPDFGAPTTEAGDMVRPVATFLLPFIATAGYLGAAAKSMTFLKFLRSGGTFRNSVLQGSIAGGIVDYAAVDPNDGNISTMLAEYPSVDPYIPEYFVHKINDTQFEKRLRNVVEGAALGAVAESLIQGVRVARQASRNKEARRSLGLGDDVDVNEAARKRTSNLTHARMTYYNVEILVKELEKLGVKDPAFSEALSYLESLERVGRKADEGVGGAKAADDAAPDAPDATPDAPDVDPGTPGLDPEYEKLSPEAKAFVDSSENLASQYETKSRKQALETHYNALGKDSDLSKSALEELELRGGERGAKIAEALRTDIRGNMDEYLDQAEKHLIDMEKEFDAVINPKGAAHKALGPAQVKDLIVEADAAYPRGYTNKITKSFDDGPTRGGVRRIESEDPLWGGNKSKNIEELEEALTPTERLGLVHAMRSGDIDAVDKFLRGLEREGKPSGLDSIWRKYEDRGAASLLEEISAVMNRADLSEGGKKATTKFRTQTLKSVNISAKDLALRTIKQMTADFETAATTIGASKRALLNLIEIDPSDPIKAYNDLAIKMQALRLVEQHSARAVSDFISKGGSMSMRDGARAVTIMDEFGALVSGSRTLRRESARSLRAQAMPVERQYEEIIAEVGGIGPLRDRAEMFVAASEQASSNVDALRQASLFLRKTTWRMRKEAMVTYWLGAILSSPTTQVVNIASNTVASLWFQTEQVIGSMIPRQPAMPGFKAWSRELQETAGRVKDELAGYAAIKRGVVGAFKLNSMTKSKLWKAYQEGDFKQVAEDMASPENQELGYFWSSLFTGKPQMDAATKFDMRPDGDALSLEKLFPHTSQNSTMGKGLTGVLATLNAVPSASFRMLMAGDAAAKSINYRMKLATSARKLARKKLDKAASRGLDDASLPEGTYGRFTSEDADKFVRDMEDNAFNWDDANNSANLERQTDLKYLHDQSTRYSQYATFTEPQEFASMSRWLQNRSQISPEMKFILPFINTPTNLIKAVGERTPIAWRMLGKYRKALAEGDTEVIYELKTRMRMGSMLWIGAGSLAIDGRITGGAPRDPEERARFIERGIPEYSVWFKLPYGDIPKGQRKWWTQDRENPSISWFTYGRLEPLATIFKISADVAESMGDLENDGLEELFAVGMSATADNILSQSYFEGLSRVMGLFLEPERTSVSGELENLAASFIPNVLMTGRKSFSDDGMKEAQTLSEKLLNRTPVLASKLLAKTNFFNEARVYPKGWGSFVNPFYSGDWERDSVAEALDDTKVSVNQRRIYGQLRGLPLSPEDVSRYKVLANGLKIGGMNMKRALELTIQTKAFKDAGPTSEDNRGGRHEMLTQIIDAYLKRAQRIMLNTHEVKRRLEVERAIAYGLEKEGNLPGNIIRALLDEQDDWNSESVAER